MIKILLAVLLLTLSSCKIQGADKEQVDEALRLANSCMQSVQCSLAWNDCITNEENAAGDCVSQYKECIEVVSENASRS